MKILQSCVFVAFLIGTLNLVAMQQRPSQETTDAIQNQRLEQIIMDHNALVKQNELLGRQIDALQREQDRIVGLGEGVAVGLTTLQGLLVILTFKNGSRKGQT